MIVIDKYSNSQLNLNHHRLRILCLKIRQDLGIHEFFILLDIFEKIMDFKKFYAAISISVKWKRQHKNFKNHYLRHFSVFKNFFWN